MHINIERLKSNGYYGIGLLIALIVAVVVLSYVLLHNPYQDVHERIFNIAEKVNKYYREKPNYWKLSTETAIEDDLIGNIKDKYKEYDFSIGQGADGKVSMPSDSTFDIALKHLSKSACISLSEYIIPEEKRVSLMKITITNNDKTTVYSWGEEQKLPVKKYSARSICAAKENTIIWTFQ